MVCRFQGQWGLCEFLPLGWPKLYFKATWKKVRLPNSIKSWHSGVQKRQIPFSGTRRRRCTTSEIHEKLKQRLDTVPSGTCVYDHSPSGAYRMQNSWWHTTLNVSFTQYSVRPPHISACQRFWLAAGRRVGCGTCALRAAKNAGIRRWWASPMCMRPKSSDCSL